MFSDGRPLKNGKYIFTMDITDFTDTVSVKLFFWEEQLDEIAKDLKVNDFIKVKGVAKFDDYVGEISISSVVGIKKIKDFTTTRMDLSMKKRVELHCHTKMSDSDGVTYAKDLIARAHKWGMPALAITDHGVVQAFPEALHAVEKMEGMKVIYGVEAYIVDDLVESVVNARGQTLVDEFVVFDIETDRKSVV